MELAEEVLEMDDGEREVGEREGGSVLTPSESLFIEYDEIEFEFELNFEFRADKRGER